MTTVINLNILNVFGQNADQHSVNKSQLNSNSSKRREISFPDHRTIDVTPTNPAVSYNKPALDKIRKVPVMVSEQPEVLTCYPKTSETRYLNAYSSDCFIPKGTNIDSYA